MSIATKNKNKAKEVKKKDSPWTKLGISVDLSSSLTRQVLIEKFSFEKAKEIEMRDFFLSKIDKCELFTHDDYKDYIFYIKKINGNNEVLMEKNIKNKYFNIKYTNFWSVFESKYELNYNDVQLLTQGYLLEALNSEGYKTSNNFVREPVVLLEALNSEGYKTQVPNIFTKLASLLEALNPEGYKTRMGN